MQETISVGMPERVLWLLIFGAIGVLFLFLLRSVANGPGDDLARHISWLARHSSLSGRTYQEIVTACGEPTEVSITAEGRKCCLWVISGMEIRLIFDSHNVCLGKAEKK